MVIMIPADFKTEYWWAYLIVGWALGLVIGTIIVNITCKLWDRYSEWAERRKKQKWENQKNVGNWVDWYK